MLKTFMKLFIARNGQKFAHFMQVSFSFISMQEAHIQIGLFLPSHQGRKQRYHQCENPQKPPPPRKQTQSHTPPLQSLRVGQYIIPLPPPYSNVFLVLAPSGKPDSSVKIACLARLPLLYLSSTWPGPASAGLLGKIPG